MNTFVYISMKKGLLTILLVLFATVSLVPAGLSSVQAQQSFSICTLLGPLGNPFGCATGEFGSQSASQYLLPRIQLVLTLAFIGLIVFAIVYVVRAAITYIQSQGKPEEIENATKSIRSVFIGLGALFVGIAGILLVIAFFGGDTGGFGGSVDIRCIERPQCCTNRDGSKTEYGAADSGATCPAV